MKKTIFNFLFKNSSNKQIIVKNTLWLTAAEIGSKFLLFLITIFIVRYLGVEMYGKYSFTVAFTGMFSVLVDFGLGTLILQEFSVNKRAISYNFGSLVILKFFLALITYSLVMLIVPFMKISADVRLMVYFAGAYMIIQSFALMFPTVFQAFEKMQFNFIIRIVSNVILFLLIFTVILSHLPVNTIFIAYIISAFITVVLSSVLINRYLFKIKYSLDTEYIRQALRRSRPLFLGNICTTLYTYVDTTLLSSLRSYQEVGLYQAAYKILYVFQSLGLIHVVLFPQMAKLYVTNKEKLNDFLKKIISLSFILFIPALAIIGVFRYEIIQLIYGPRYNSAANLMFVLIAGGYIAFISGFFVNILLIKKKQIIWLLTIAVSLIVNIITNIVLIPIYGNLGSAIAYGIGALVSLCLLILLSRKHSSLF